MEIRHRNNDEVNCDHPCDGPSLSGFVGIRETASIIFTNFDMIHASILPHEDLWRKSVIDFGWHNTCFWNDSSFDRFFKNLKIMAVDELHYYSDLFGR
jgi:DEAD/DEAH box helicase domain-containing protein